MNSLSGSDPSRRSIAPPPTCPTNHQTRSAIQKNPQSTETSFIQPTKSAIPRVSRQDPGITLQKARRGMTPRSKGALPHHVRFRSGLGPAGRGQSGPGGPGLGFRDLTSGSTGPRRLTCGVRKTRGACMIKSPRGWCHCHFWPRFAPGPSRACGSPTTLSWLLGVRCNPLHTALHLVGELVPRA